MPSQAEMDALDHAANAADNPGEPAPADPNAGSRTTEASSSSKKDRTHWFRPPGTHRKINRDFEPVTVVRDELVHGASPESSREVEFSSETVRRHTRFLESYVANLNKLKKIPSTNDPDKTMWDVIMEDPAEKFAYDKEVMDLFGTTVVGTDGKELTHDVNLDKIQDFLRTSTGWAMTTQLMEQYGLMTQLGTGMEATIKSLYNKGQGSDKRSYSAILHRHKTAPYAVRFGLEKTLSGLKVAGFFTFLPGATRIRHDQASSLITDLKDNATPAELEYIKAMIGVDLSKIEVQKNGDLRYTGAQPDYDTLVERDNEVYAAREAFFAELGVDPKNVRLPEEFIFKYGATPENLQLVYYKEIMDEFDRLNLQASNASRFDRAQGMATARRTVMLRYAKEYKDRIKAQKQEKRITRLEDKATAMEDGRKDELTARRSKKATEAKEAAAEGKAAAEKTKTEKVDPLTAKSEAILSIERELIEQFDIGYDADFDGAISAQIKVLEHAKNQAKTDFNEAVSKKAQDLTTATNGIQGQIIAFNSQLGEAIDLIKQAQAARRSAQIPLPTVPDISGGVTLAKEAANTQHDEIIQQRREELKKAEEKLEALKKKHTEYRNAVWERITTVRGQLSEEPQIVEKCQDAYDEFTSSTGVGLTPDEVRDTPADELAEKLYPGKDPKQKQEALKKVFYAKAEQDARQKEIATPIPAYQMTALNAILGSGAGIATEDIIRMSQSELAGALRGAGMSAPDIATNLPAARLAAERKLMTRFAANNQTQIDYYDGEAIKQDEILKKLGDFTEQKAQIRVTTAIMRKQTDIYDRSKALESKPGGTDPFTDNTVIDADDRTYSDAERSKPGLEKWYVNVFYHLYPEAKGDPRREELFETFYQTITPDDLKTAMGTGKLQEMMQRVVNNLVDRAEAA